LFVGSLRMYEVTVIGYGASLRQDDGFGPIVLAELESLVDDPRAKLISCQTLTPELAEILSRSRQVIFVDACAELPPGDVAFRQIGNDESADVSLVHFLSPEALLVWTQRLYGHVPTAELWLVGVQETGLSEELTPPVQSRVAEFVTRLESRIVQILANP